jgi:hypothetical protein
MRSLRARFRFPGRAEIPVREQSRSRGKKAHASSGKENKFPNSIRNKKENRMLKMALHRLKGEWKDVRQEEERKDKRKRNGCPDGIISRKLPDPCH